MKIEDVFYDMLQADDIEKLFSVYSDAADLQHGLGMPLYGPEGTSAGIVWRLNENPLVQSFRINLSSRELEVLRWQAAGTTKTEIADKLNISYHTVDYHTRRILHKFKARNVTAAVHFAPCKDI